MKTIKLEMFLEVDDNGVEEVKKLEHHIDWLLNLGEYPEIKSVFGVKVSDETPFKTYKAEYADENFEVFQCDNDREAIQEAESYESEHGVVFNVYEVDENYDVLRMIY